MKTVQPSTVIKAAQAAIKTRNSEAGERNAVMATLARYGYAKLPQMLKGTADGGAAVRMYVWEGSLGDDDLVLVTGPSIEGEIHTSSSIGIDVAGGPSVWVEGIAYTGKGAKEAAQAMKRAAARVEAQADVKKPRKRPTRKPMQKSLTRTKAEKGRLREGISKAPPPPGWRHGLDQKLLDQVKGPTGVAPLSVWLDGVENHVTAIESNMAAAGREIVDFKLEVAKSHLTAAEESLAWLQKAAPYFASWKQKAREQGLPAYRTASLSAGNAIQAVDSAWVTLGVAGVMRSNTIKPWADKGRKMLLNVQQYADAGDTGMVLTDFINTVITYQAKVTGEREDREYTELQADTKRRKARVDELVAEWDRLEFNVEGAIADLKMGKPVRVNIPETLDRMVEIATDEDINAYTTGRFYGETKRLQDDYEKVVRSQAEQSGRLATLATEAREYIEAERVLLKEDTEDYSPGYIGEEMDRVDAAIERKAEPLEREDDPQLQRLGATLREVLRRRRVQLERAAEDYKKLGAIPYPESVYTKLGEDVPSTVILQPRDLDSRTDYMVWEWVAGSWVAERSYPGHYIISSLMDGIRSRATAPRPWIVTGMNVDPNGEPTVFEEVDRGRPEEGKVYSLGGIAQGKSWAESEVEPEPIMVEEMAEEVVEPAPPVPPEEAGLTAADIEAIKALAGSILAGS